MARITRIVPSSARRVVARAIGRDRNGGASDLYVGDDYLESYIAHTNRRVAENPKSAIGGMWEEIGQLQFDFLRQMGLKPTHSMLDIGCGTLRGGRYFIRYLDPSNYTGIDISPACLDAARKLLEDEGLTDKTPNLVLNEGRTMQFRELRGQRFDFILAQSVFTHLPESIIQECFANVKTCMHETSVFYFTYSQASENKRVGNKHFAYPWAFFEHLARTNGFVSEEMSHLYPHPRGQKMGKISSV
jgi:ubiquinone/menaquinone biosynthesis C-methylase UbiE